MVYVDPISLTLLKSFVKALYGVFRILYIQDYIIHKGTFTNSDIFCFIFYIIALAGTSSANWIETVRVDHFAFYQSLENKL